MNNNYSYGLLQWETWLMIELQQESPSHCLRIIPELNFSQAIPISGLRKHKAREAKTWTQWGKATFWFGFLRTRRCTYQMTKHWQFTSSFLLLFPTVVLPWRRPAILSGGEHHHANVNPKWSMELYFLQDTSPTTENTGHQSSSMELFILNLQVFILNLETSFH